MVVVGALGACSGGSQQPAAVVVASTTTTQSTPLTESTLATPPPAPPPPAAPGPAPAVGGLKPADGRPYGGAVAFRTAAAVPAELTFVLVVGSDARPGQDPRRANADSVHLLAVDPRTGQGTVLGFPRDSWVQVPGRGNAKLTSALPSGGMGLMVDTVRRLTGLPVHYSVLTGFEGLASMVDALGGVDVAVDRMDDHASGARFERGWHHFNGAQALALARNRKDAPNGDFGRSANQGTLMLAALAKMRAEVGDDGGLRRWIDVLSRHASFDVAPDRLLGLAALARGLDPAGLRNVVVPGRIGTAGRQSVVFLGEEAARLFADLRPDAVPGGATAAPPAAPPPTTAAPGPAPSTTTTTLAPVVTTTTSTTAPPPITLLP